jgi:hypothetical protein
MLKETAVVDVLLEPTVRFDVQTATIFLTVIATPNPEISGEFNVVAAPVSVPRGTWKMVWDLRSSDELDRADFDKVVLEPNPLPNVQTSDSRQVSPTEWRAVIDNHVTSFNGFSYFIHVVPAGKLQPVTRHDPSIAVTSDPITG